MRVRRGWLVALAGWLMLWGGATAGAGYGLADALRELHDLSLLHAPADPPRRAFQLSSWDRNDGPFDQGNFLRQDGAEMVLLDVEGPGVLTRLWTSEPMGKLRFYWDGATEPQLEVPWQELMEGKVSPLVAPLVGTASGAGVMRFPLPFARGLKVTLSDETTCAWQLQYHAFADGAAVVSWWPALGPVEGARDAFNAVADAWEHPAAVAVAGDLAATSVTLTAGARLPLPMPEQGGPRLVTEIAVVQSGEEADVLAGELTLMIARDGAEPVEIPWRALAGVWEGEGDSASLLQGRSDGRSYFRVPFVHTPGRDELMMVLHDDATDAFVGEVQVRSLPAPAGEAGPGLFLLSATPATLRPGGEIAAKYAGGPGRLLLAGARMSARGNTMHLESDDTIQVDGEAEPSFRGTGLDAMFDSVWHFAGGEFATATAGASLVKDGGAEVGARMTWWPGGVPFAQGVRVAIGESPASAAPAVGHGMFVVGQRFSPAGDCTPQTSAIEHRPVLDTALFGRRVHGPADACGLPGVVVYTPPVTATLRPHEAWLEPDGEVQGTFVVHVAAPGLQLVRVHLDLPLGWTGTLKGMEQDLQVFDIGWPWVEFWDPPAGEMAFTWTARPGEVVHPGSTLVQCRAEVSLHNGQRFTVRHPTAVFATPRGPLRGEWEAAAIHDVGGGEYAMALPAGFDAQEGDLLVVDLTATDDGPAQGVATVHHFPLGAAQNAESVHEDVVAAMPPDGTTPGRVRFDGVRHRAFFPVGQNVNWIGSPRRLTISFAGRPETAVEFHGAGLLKRLPTPTHYAERVPFRENPVGTFRRPDSVMTLMGEELVAAVRPLVQTPQDQSAAELRPTELLENVVAAPVGFRIAEQRVRHRPNLPSPGLHFPARHIGERIEIHHPAIQGATRIGVQFGYGPWCGTVAVRDCEGRLAAVHDLYFPEPVTFPQYLDVPLAVPSRDPWIYIEALGPSVGGRGLHIPIQKVMVLPAQPTP